MEQVNNELSDIIERYNLSFSYDYDISKGFGDYVDKSLIRLKGDKYPAFYYNSINGQTLKVGLEEALFGRGHRSTLPFVKTSHYIMEGEKNKPSCYSCMLYIDEDRLADFSFAISYMVGKSEKLNGSEFYKNVTNVHKFNYFGETRPHNALPIALFDDSLENISNLLNTLRNINQNVAFDVYKVTREINGETKDLYELNLLPFFDKDYVSWINYKSSVINEAIKPNLLGILKFKDKANCLCLLDASGKPINSAHLQKLLKLENWNFFTGLLDNLISLNSTYEKIKIPEKPQIGAISSEKSVLSVDKLAVYDVAQLKNYTDETMLSASQGMRSVLVVISTSDFKNLQKARGFAPMMVPSCDIKSKKIEVLKKINEDKYFENVFSVSNNEEIRFFTMIPLLYSELLRKKLTNSNLNAYCINAYGEKRACGEVPVALINKPADSPEACQIMRELKESGAFEYTIRDVTREFHGTKFSAAEISVNMLATKEKREATQFLSSVLGIYENLQEICEEKGVGTSRLYINGEVREEFNQPEKTLEKTNF